MRLSEISLCSGVILFMSAHDPLPYHTHAQCQWADEVKALIQETRMPQDRTELRCADLKQPALLWSGTFVCQTEQ